MHTYLDMIHGWLRANPFHQQRLKFFGRERPKYHALIFTKNSPLARVFNHGLLKMRELGSLYQVLDAWKGHKENKVESMPTMVLGPGQVRCWRLEISEI